MLNEVMLSRLECTKMIREGNVDGFRQRLPEHMKDPVSRDLFLSVATEDGPPEILELLHECGFDVLQTDNVVVEAARRGRLEIVQWLIDHGAPVNGEWYGIHCSYAVEVAANGGHSAVVKLLLDNGAVISSQAQKHLLGRCTPEVCEVLKSLSTKTPLQIRKEEETLGALLATRLPGEFEHLAAHVDNLADNSLRRKYAKWLTSQGDKRGSFLNKFAAACKSMNLEDFPDPEKYPSANDEWLEVIGNSLIPEIAEYELVDFQEAILRLTRPAIDLVSTEATDNDLAVGASKIGGLPDLPAGVKWPVTRDCISYHGSPPDSDEPCLFLGQINFAELAGLIAARELPSTGLMSIFAVLDWNTGYSGIRILWHKDVQKLQRREAPEGLPDADETEGIYALSFQDLLMVPDKDGPWKDELGIPDGSGYSSLLRSPVYHLLGHLIPANTDDPTPDKAWRHLLTFTGSMGKVYVQIRQEDLAAHNLERATLMMVESIAP